MSGLRCLWPTRWISPAALLMAAFVILLCTLGLHAVGAREHVGILSGTPAGGLCAVLGLTYVVFHFAAWLLVPILVLGALGMGVWLWLFGWRR